MPCASISFCSAAMTSGAPLAMQPVPPQTRTRVQPLSSADRAFSLQFGKLLRGATDLPLW
jgi:hypothetical protein